MKQWVALTRVIATLLLTYPQVYEYGSFHFFARRLVMNLSVNSTSTPRRISTEATKGVKCQCSLVQVWRHFFFFYCLIVSRQLSVFLDW